MLKYVSFVVLLVALEPIHFTYTHSAFQGEIFCNSGIYCYDDTSGVHRREERKAQTIFEI
jgi:hypothetical protein